MKFNESYETLRNIYEVRLVCAFVHGDKKAVRRWAKAIERINNIQKVGA